MINDDTLKLLNECDAGIKMAVSSIDEVLPSVKSEKMKQCLSDCKQEHEKLGIEAHRILNNYNDSGKDPNPIAKGMSWIKTNVTLSINPTDNSVADLMMDGCNMGIKSLNKYLNEYKTAEKNAKDITQQLIRSEEQMSTNLRSFI